MPPAVRVWIINHCTTREVPNTSFYFDVLTLGASQILESLSLPKHNKGLTSKHAFHMQTNQFQSHTLNHILY